MKKKRHCDLCDHQILSLKEGNICGLTKHKPHFQKLCTKIELNSTLYNRLEEVLINYEDLNLFKKKVYVEIFFSSIIGVVIVLCGYLVWRYFLNQNYDLSLYALKFILFIPFIILSAGFVFIKKAFNKFFSFRKNLKLTKESKNAIDEVLKLYNKRYTYQIEFDNEIHGVQEVGVNIKIS